jgi:hypothetical protein
MRLYLEKKKSQKMTGGVAQGVGPEFKPQYCKTKQKPQNLGPHGDYILGEMEITQNPPENLIECIN